MKYGLIGEKLGHSYSKLIQEKLLDHYTYELHPLAKEEVDDFMKAKAFRAINVTIPYKQIVIPYLDAMDDASTKIKAVNTIVNKNGALYGYNTDYYGFRYMLDHHHIAIEGKKVLVMGNGGASKAIQAVVQDLHAQTMLVVDIVLSEGVLSLNEVYTQHHDVDVIINTTPLGMYPNVDGICLDLHKFSHVEACIDVVYNPYRTELALQAEALGIQAITGLEMLVAQAKYALEYFKDIEINDAEIDRIYKEILCETCNLVVTNMSAEDIDLLQAMTHKKVLYTDESNLREHSIKTNVILVWDQDKKRNDTIDHELRRNGFIVSESHAEEAFAQFQNIIKTR